MKKNFKPKSKFVIGWKANHKYIVVNKSHKHVVTQKSRPQTEGL